MYYELGDPSLVLTNHARERAHERRIDYRAIVAARRHGRRYHVEGGKSAYHLGPNEVTTARLRGHRIDPYANVAIVIAEDEFGNEIVLTVELVPALPSHWRRASLGRGL